MHVDNVLSLGLGVTPPWKMVGQRLDTDKWPNELHIILGDEPTASLDSERAGQVMDLLRKLAQEQDAAVIIVTHDEKIFDRSDRIFHLRDGKL